MWSRRRPTTAATASAMSATNLLSGAQLLNRFVSPSDAVHSLYLGPYGNGATLVQPAASVSGSIVRDGGVATGPPGFQQTPILNRNAFQIGRGTGALRMIEETVGHEIEATLARLSALWRAEEAADGWTSEGKSETTLLLEGLKQKLQRGDPRTPLNISRSLDHWGIAFASSKVLRQTIKRFT